MHNYHDQFKQLPPGATANPRHTWVVHLWPYVEQGNLAQAYGPPNANPFYTSPRINTSAFTGVCAQIVPLYYCPSDRPNAYDTHDTYYRCRGNYVVNWGLSTIPTTGMTAQAPFGYQNNNTSQPQVTTMNSFTDGTSNTLLLSERLIALNDGDQNSNGDFLNDDPAQAGAMFMTINTPNSGTDTIFCGVSNDILAPCQNGSNLQATARSRHTGGVTAMLGDGSVRFVNNSIALATWSAMGTMNGGDIVTLDQ
jgi:hypothetical protein